MSQSSKLHVNSAGFAQLFALFVALAFIYLFAKVMFTPPVTPGPESESTVVTAGGQCCDSGDGDACRPFEESDKTFTFQMNGKKYGLLKSGVKLMEGTQHLADSTERTPSGDPIIINTSEGFHEPDHDCGSVSGRDQVFGPRSMGGNLQRCVAIDNDVLVYVCKENCVAAPNDQLCGVYLTCYGSPETVYDVYYSLPDYHANGIPDVIKNCDAGAGGEEVASSKTILVEPSPSADDSLQLKTFTIVKTIIQAGSQAWISPWCKPAIYLYPEEKTDVRVQVAPKGQMNLTIPPYPKEGWLVTAYPNGNIESDGASYPYLYYEARMPDENIYVPKEGFVVEKQKLAALLSDILPKTGLNASESRDFSEYWLNVLPDAPYFFVGIIPQANLDEMAPLTIAPVPAKVIRVSLYFQALENQQFTVPPTITTPARDGFTVVEWGGIFKRDTKYPFSCYM
jgi:hypothetical protein